jgi:prophage regulatory protein
MANTKSLTINEAKALAEGWDAEWDRQCYDAAVDDHFRDVSASQLVSMWESQTNEKGQPLTNFEFRALCSAWLQTFGCLPPDNDAADAGTADTETVPSEPAPDDDTMLRMPDVVRLTGVSESTIKRMMLDGRFPKSMHLSQRSIGWPARDVKAWLRQLDDQRRASRQ